MPAPPELSEPAMVSAIADVALEAPAAFRALLQDLRLQLLGVSASSMRANAGTFSISHCPNQLSEPVSIRTPVSNQQHAHHHLDVAQMAAEALQKADERPDRHGRQHEGNAEPERVDEQQAHARAEAALVGRQRQHGRQHRADAGRPAEREGKPHHEGARQARALARWRGSAPGDRASGTRSTPRKCRPKPMMIDAGDQRQLRPCAACTHWPSTEAPAPSADEHRREAQHEEQRGQHDAPPQRGVDAAPRRVICSMVVPLK